MQLATLSQIAVTPLGLAAAPGQDKSVLASACEAGLNFFFCYGANYPGYIAALRKTARSRREEIFIATGSGARSIKGLKAARRKLSDSIDTEYFDVFFAEYVHPGDDDDKIFGPGGVLDELSAWKAKGLIRYAGASTHDRALALRLTRDSRVDILMHRYNMAHRKAEEKVFPAAIESETPVVAFTATRWGTLLEQKSNWPADPPSAGDCYRFCLAQPSVQVVLTAPQNESELRENLSVLELPKMNSQEHRHWKQFGDLVYKQGQGNNHDFEAKWP